MGFGERKVEQEITERTEGWNLNLDLFGEKNGGIKDFRYFRFQEFQISD